MLAFANETLPLVFSSFSSQFICFAIFMTLSINRERSFDEAFTQAHFCLEIDRVL